jgi:mRNA interferase RelE/StbE
MEIVYLESFNKEILKIKDKNLKEKIADIIDEIENAQSITEIRNLKKLTGYKYHYRIRVGDYRIGIYFNNNKLELARFMHRKDIYKYFP